MIRCPSSLRRCLGSALAGSNVAAHRLGTVAVASALVDHPSVAQAAVIGVTDEVAGQSIAACATLKDGWLHSVAPQDALKQRAVQKIASTVVHRVVKTLVAR